MSPFSKIESVQNSMVKHAYSLKVPKKIRESQDFLCEGFHLVQEAMKSGLRVRFIFATAEAWSRPEGRGIAAEAQREKVRCFEAPAKIAAYLADTASPQGMIAVAAKVERPLPSPPPSLLLAVHQVQDPGNMGTLFRSAEAFGAGALLLTEGCCEPYNPKTVRASMGSLFRVPFLLDQTLDQCFERAKTDGYESLALSMEGSEPLTEAALKPRTLFWVGAEGAGLPSAVLDRCDRRVRVPMEGQVESLNVAVAASIALFWAHSKGPLP